MNHINDVFRLLVDYIYNRFVKYAVELPHSRLMEEEADLVGLRLAAKVNNGFLKDGRYVLSWGWRLKACYDVRQAIGLWKRMAERDHESDRWALSSSHPLSTKRANKLQSLMPLALDLRLQCNCYELLTLGNFISLPTLNRRVRCVLPFGCIHLTLIF